MGKSDQFIFPEYLKILNNVNAESIAFLGFSKENDFTISLKSPIKNFYDLTLGNWDINSDWKLDRKYDLIISTRCPYFSKDPSIFVRKCLDSTTDGGHVLLDWGLGDHWRFNNYKVGWYRNGELEYAYHPKNYLYSCFWNDELVNDSEVKKFWDAVKRNPQFGYHEVDDLSKIVKLEVPTIIDYPTQKIKTKFLWPDNPQLYIITLLKRS